LRIEQPPLPWQDDVLLADAAERAMEALLAQADTLGGPWAVFWAAGTVVTSSSPDAMTEELRQFRVVLNAIRLSVSGHPQAQRGCVFFASSAGGVYGGSADPPFTELSTPVPISPYGHFKLHGETILEEFSRHSGVSSLSGRISNLYGPGQRLDKMQGLISHVALAQFTGAPTSIYVPLDTLRDYIFVTDCASLIVDSTMRALAVTEQQGPIQATKNLISGRAVTISSLLGYFRVLAKGHPRVMLGSSAAAALQALDLRLESVVWPDLDKREQETLPSGITATMTDILAGIQRGSANRP
jgi:UDP-glucose 4-epimerase